MHTDGEAELLARLALGRRTVVEINRAAILAAGLEVFAELGYGASTVRDIIDHADEELGEPDEPQPAVHDDDAAVELDHRQLMPSTAGSSSPSSTHLRFPEAGRSAGRRG